MGRIVCFALVAGMAASPLARAEAPWPSVAHDPQQTGRAAIAVASRPEMLWRFQSGDVSERRAPSGAPVEILASGPLGVTALTADGAARWQADLNDPSLAEQGPGGAVYVTEETGPGQGALVALDSEGRERWRQPIPGLPWWPALAADGGVYVVNYRSDMPSAGAAADLVAVNPDGSARWRYPAGFPLNRCPRALPDGDVVFRRGDQEIVAVTPQGAKRWSYALTNATLGCPQVGADSQVVFPSSSLPGLVMLSASGSRLWQYRAPVGMEDATILSDGTAAGAGFDGALYAVGTTGALKWRRPTGAAILLEVTPGPNGTVLALTDDGTIYDYDAAGSLLWSSPLGDGAFHPFSEEWPVRRLQVGPSGTIALNAMRQAPYLMKAVNPRGETLWTWDEGSTLSGIVVGDAGRVYAAGDAIYALASDGSLLWRYRGEARGYSPPVLLPDGTLLARGEQSMVALNPDGTLRWKRPLPTPDFAPTTPVPAPAGGFTGSSSGDLVLLNGDGSTRWRYSPPACGPGCVESVTSPAVGPDGSIIAGVSSASLSLERPLPVGPEYPPFLIAFGSDGGERWRFQTSEGAPFGPPSVGPDGTVYAISGGTLYAVDDRGSERWHRAGFAMPGVRKPLAATDGGAVSTDPGQAPVLTGDDRILAPAPDGQLRAVTTAGQDLWSAKVGLFYRTVVDARGTAVTVGDEVTALDPSGAKLWAVPLPALGGTAGPAIGADGTVYAGAGGSVVALGGSTPLARADVDGDGRVTLKDVTLVLRLVTGLPIADPPVGPGGRGDPPWLRGDVDGNGKLEIRDAISALRLAIGLPI